MEWSCTRTVLVDLNKLLTCGLCKKILSDPCTLGNCDHNFCRKCIEKKVGSDSSCPDCGAFSWLKDLKSNRQLSMTVSMVTKLSSLIGPSKGQHECHSEVTSFERVTDTDSPKTPVQSDAITAPTVCSDANETSLSNDSPKMQISPEKENKVKEVKEIARAKVVTDRKSRENHPVKTYALRGKLKRQLSPSVTSSNVDNDQNDISNERSLRSRDTTSGHKPSENTPVGKKTKHSQADEISGQMEKSTESHFTSIKPRLPRSDTSNHEGEVQKKIKNGNLTGIGDGNKTRIEVPGNKTHTEVPSTSHEKENKIVSLNVKRRKMRRRSTDIKQYLVEVVMNSSSEELTPVDTLSHTQSSSQKLKKATVHRNISSSQESRNKRGETPLHLAAMKGDVCTAVELIKEGANPNAKDNAGWTPLHEACNHGNVDVVELLLDHGASINLPGFDNDTPLHDAVANSRLDVVKLLVKRGASLQARNKQGLMPMDYAATRAMKSALHSRCPTETGIWKSPKTEGVSKIANNRANTAVVVLGTALSSREKEILEKCVPRLGGSLLSEFNESVTHVVTSVNKEGFCPRTIKYFSGVLTGKWIVCFKWVSDSIYQRKWIKEDDYEVCGTAGNTLNGPMQSRINMTQQLPPLFEGCSFFLRGNFNPPTPNKQDLLNLIKLGGGRILHREPKVKDDDVTLLPGNSVVASFSSQPQVAYHARANSSLSCCTQFIIYDPTHRANQKIIFSPVLCTAPVTWLMDCISSFQLLDIPDKQ